MPKFIFCLILLVAAGRLPGQDAPADLLRSFALVGSTDTALAERAVVRLDRLATDLGQRYRHNKPARSLERLFRDVHAELFVRYVDNPVFADIFRNGHYNCVTATAVYAYLFDRLDIPYEIRRQPTHVYVVAYPGAHDIVVESTLPGEDELRSRREQLRLQVQDMLANKLITPEEAATQDFAAGDVEIGFPDLRDVLLYNYSILQLETGDHLGSLRTIAGASDHLEAEFVLPIVAFNLVGLTESEAPMSAEEKCFVFSTFHELCLDLVPEPAGELSSIFYHLTGEPETESDIEDTEALLSCIADRSVADTLLSDLRSVSDINAAVYYHRSLRTQRALDHLSRSFRPENTKAYLLIREVLITHLTTVRDPAAGLDTLGKYQELFPFLHADDVLRGYAVTCYAQLIKMSYDLGEADEGQYLLEAFERKFPAEAGATFEANMIGYIYGSVSSYYVRRKDEAAALEWLDRGMQYSKNSYELRNKRKLLTSDDW